MFYKRVFSFEMKVLRGYHEQAHQGCRKKHQLGIPEAYRKHSGYGDFSCPNSISGEVAQAELLKLAHHVVVPKYPYISHGDGNGDLDQSYKFFHGFFGLQAAWNLVVKRWHPARVSSMIPHSCDIPLFFSTAGKSLPAWLSWFCLASGDRCPYPCICLWLKCPPSVFQPSKY